VQYVDDFAENNGLISSNRIDKGEKIYIVYSDKLPITMALNINNAYVDSGLDVHLFVMKKSDKYCGICNNFEKVFLTKLSKKFKITKINDSDRKPSIMQ